MATPSTSTERIVVVVGSMGVGKSTFIKKFCPPDGQKPVASDSPTHETKEERLYDSRESDIKLMDTVGFDRKQHKSVVPMSLLKGKLVHFVVLLSSRRWGSQLDQVSECLNWAKLDGNITKWAAHDLAFADSNDAADSAYNKLHRPPSIDGLESLVGLRFAVAVPAAPLPRPVAIASAQPAPHVPELVKLYKDMGWSALPPKKMITPEAWRRIKKQQTVADNRQKGESLLKLHLFAMRPDVAGNLESNNTLQNVVRNVEGLEQYILSLYPNNEATGLGKEKLGDYVEALCYELRSTKSGRRLFASFLDAICAQA